MNEMSQAFTEGQENNGCVLGVPGTQLAKCWVAMTSVFPKQVNVLL